MKSHDYKLFQFQFSQFVLNKCVNANVTYDHVFPSCLVASEIALWSDNVCSSQFTYIEGSLLIQKGCLVTCAYLLSLPLIKIRQVNKSGSRWVWKKTPKRRAYLAGTIPRLSQNPSLPSTGPLRADLRYAVWSGLSRKSRCIAYALSLSQWSPFPVGPL